MATELILDRVKEDEATHGEMRVFKNNSYVGLVNTLELKDNGNQRNISCIPEGEYKIRRRKTKKFGNHLEVLDVPNRDGILIHVANFYTQLKGCIAVGFGTADLNRDGIFDVTSSGNALKFLDAVTKGDSNIILTINNSNLIRDEETIS